MWEWIVKVNESIQGIEVKFTGGAALAVMLWLLYAAIYLAWYIVRMIRGLWGG